MDKLPYYLTAIVIIAMIIMYTVDMNLRRHKELQSQILELKALYQVLEEDIPGLQNDIDSILNGTQEISSDEASLEKRQEVLKRLQDTKDFCALVMHNPKLERHVKSMLFWDIIPKYLRKDPRYNSFIITLKQFRYMKSKNMR